MNTDTIQKLNNQFGQAFIKASEPARKLAELTLVHTENLLAFQFNAASSYVNLGLNQFRSVLSVSNANDLQTWFSNQQAVTETVAKRLNDDTRTVVGFGRTYAEQASNLATESAKALGASVVKRTGTA